MTGIEWTDMVWNPTTGCDRISAGCDNCYALTMARRLKGMGQAKYQNDGDPRTSGPGFGLTVHESALTIPMHWREPKRVFVNSMSDLFHARVPEAFIVQVFAMMMATPRHTYQVLTKRTKRMRRIVDSDRFAERTWEAFHALDSGEHLYWPPRNVWLGTSIENEEEADRREGDLLSTPAAVRFISAEPLLEAIDFQFDHECGDPPHWTCPVPDWLIIGGESGPGARRMELAWVRDIIAQCRDAGTAVFVKQLGSVLGAELGAGSKGGDWDAWPDDLRIREYPWAAQGAAA